LLQFKTANNPEKVMINLEGLAPTSPDTGRLANVEVTTDMPAQPAVKNKPVAPPRIK
jgi:hypothetical protein